MAHFCFFLSTSITLAVIIGFTLHSTHHNNFNSTNPDQLSPNATTVLRSNGFNLIATLLHISPHIFLSSSQHSTIFAVPDSAIPNHSLLPQLLKLLLMYHTCPDSNLTFQDLFEKQINTCLKTLVCGKQIAITKKDVNGRVLEINNMSVSHPDLVLEGPFSIHGVSGPFFTPPAVENKESWEIVQFPVCEANYSSSSRDSVSSRSNVGEVEVQRKPAKNLNRAEWGRIVRVLSSSGFVPLAIGLHSSIDGILQDFADLGSVTILAPPDVELMAMPLPLLNRFVRFHVIPQKHSFKQLADMPEKAWLHTLVPGKRLVITQTVNNSLSRMMSINGVEVIAPDLVSSKTFIIHGISQEFSLDEVRSVFK